MEFLHVHIHVFKRKRWLTVGMHSVRGPRPVSLRLRIIKKNCSQSLDGVWAGSELCSILIRCWAPEELREVSGSSTQRKREVDPQWAPQKLVPHRRLGRDSHWTMFYVDFCWIPANYSEGFHFTRWKSSLKNTLLRRIRERNISLSSLLSFLLCFTILSRFLWFLFLFKISFLHGCTFARIWGANLSWSWLYGFFHEFLCNNFFLFFEKTKKLAVGFLCFLFLFQSCFCQQSRSNGKYVF